MHGSAKRTRSRETHLEVAPDNTLATIFPFVMGYGTYIGLIVVVVNVVNVVVVFDFVVGGVRVVGPVAPGVVMLS
ncbi:hypothetical protein BDR26DRAFT_869981, partial [Obelidium mucronatum]